VSDPRTFRAAFDRIAEDYDDHAALEREVCSRLLERTSFNRVAPERILDLGCGTGFGSRELKQLFRKALVVGLDSSAAMLSRLQRRSGLLKPLKAVCGDISALPMATRSADMVFANLSSFWSPEPMAMFAGFRRVLRPNGMLLFSTFGPETMRELKGAGTGIAEGVELPEFPDLMEMGNALVSAGFREPVMDMEIITLSYPDPGAMLKELEATGTSLLIRGWDRLTRAEAELTRAYAPFSRDGRYPLSFEIIYGTAFGPADGQPMKTPDGDVVTFSVESLRRGRKVP